jgi:hypothetical protein
MCFYGFSDDVNSLILLKNSLISTIKNTVMPRYPLIQYPRFQLPKVYRGRKEKNWKIKEINVS